MYAFGVLWLFGCDNQPLFRRVGVEYCRYLRARRRVAENFILRVRIRIRLRVFAFTYQQNR